MRLQEKYQKTSLLKLEKALKRKNPHSLPKLEKVIISVGLSELRFDKEGSKVVINSLKAISGQNPKKIISKKSISNFKLRIGQVVAYMVTLRGKRMYDFIDKLINVTLPRIRDFRGISLHSIDENGNINLGIKEQLAFPEIKAEETDKIHGAGITIVTTAKSKKEAAELLKSLGAVVTREQFEKEKTEEEENMQIKSNKSDEKEK